MNLPVPDETPRLAVITIHGIGEYEASQAIQALSDSDANNGWIDAAQKIDFNWHDIVETGDGEGETLIEFSRALTESAQLCSEEKLDLGGSLVRNVGALLEIWFKSLWLWPAFLLVILAPFVAVYIRMGEIPAFVEVLPGYAKSGWTAMAYWSALLITAVLGAAVFLALVRQRKLAATLARRLALTVLHPVFCLLLRFGTREVAEVLGVAVKYVVGYGLIVFVIHSCTPDTAQQWVGLNPINMLMLAAAVVALIVVASLLASALDRPLKLARDIFNYIGAESQRTDIQRALDEHLTRIADGSNVVVLGHSLRSVIALDSLSNSDQWSRFGRVELITAGSPIRRFFQRFFPGLFFPSTIPQTFDHLLQRLPLAKWVNVYRAGILHGDPIGQKLFSRESRGVDIPIRQRQRRLMKAHTGYWEDAESEVHELVRTVRHESASIEGRNDNSEGSSWDFAVERLTRLHDFLADGAEKLLTTSIAASVVLAIAGFYMVVNERRAAAEDFLENVQTEGLLAEATVSHWTATWGYGKNLDFPVEFFEFTFVDVEQGETTIPFREVQSSPFEHGFYFDGEALLADLPKGHARDDLFTYQIRYIPGIGDKLILEDPKFAPIEVKDRGYPFFMVLWIGFGPVWVVVAILLWLSASVAYVLTLVLLPPAE